MQHEPTTQPPRRNFLARLGAAALGGFGLLAPMGAGVAVLLDPLRSRKAQAEGLVRITTLDALPEDGTPRRFPVIADRTDAWTAAPSERIGAVYVRRVPDQDEVIAFSAVCPHLGCFVGYDSHDDRFECPCHVSAFTLDGEVISPSPSPRGLDQLQVQVTPEGVVLVDFKDFYVGKAEKIEKR